MEQKKRVYESPSIEVIQLVEGNSLCEFSGDHQSAQTGSDALSGGHASAESGFESLSGGHEDAESGSSSGSSGHASAGFGGGVD